MTGLLTVVYVEIIFAFFIELSTNFDDMVSMKNKFYSRQTNLSWHCLGSQMIATQMTFCNRMKKLLCALQGSRILTEKKCPWTKLQRLWKVKSVTGKILFFVIAPFCTPHSICFNIGFWHGSFAWKWGFFNLSTFK